MITDRMYDAAARAAADHNCTVRRFGSSGRRIYLYSPWGSCWADIWSEPATNLGEPLCYSPAPTREARRVAKLVFDAAYAVA